MSALDRPMTFREQWARIKPLSDLLAAGRITKEEYAKRLEEMHRATGQGGEGMRSPCEFHGPDEDPCVHCLQAENERLREALRSIENIGDRAAVMVAREALGEAKA